MASIVILMSGAIGGLTGLTVGTSLFASRYIFDTMTPIYMGWGLSALCTISGFILWNLPTKNQDQFFVRALIAAGLICGGGGCAISTLLLPLFIALYLPIRDRLLVPFKENIKMNFKHQHGL